MTAAIAISADDNVATALEQIEAGEIVDAGNAKTTVTAIEAIPRGHKIALLAIAAGDRVVKYGSPIGTASHDIAAGAHVHTHNVASTRGRGDLSASRAAADSQQSAVDTSQSAAGNQQAAINPRLAEPAE